MSTQATVNLVDDEEMSSQGSVNAPVSPPQSPTGQVPTHQVPTGLPPWPGMVQLAVTSQSGVAASHGVPSPTVPVQSTEVVATPTVQVDAPSRAETRQAFVEVSFILRDVSSTHEGVKAEMQSLAMGIEVVRRQQIGEVETIAQVHTTLQRTLSACSNLEMRVGQTEVQ